MKPWQRQWQSWRGRYQALARRERVLLGLAIVLTPAVLVNMLLLQPQWDRVRQQQKARQAQMSTLEGLQAQLGSLQQQLATDPDAANKMERFALTAERDALDAQLQAAGAALLPPQAMTGLLGQLLSRHSGLRLLSLKTLAPVSIQSSAETSTARPAERAVERSFDMYRHGVEIRLEGRYGDLQAYLEHLETMPQRVIWERLEYRVIDYPRAEMSLTISTLSPERTWLAL